ncbi:ribosome maturation factor RimP [Pilimelia columellifera subsp. columellifera]|uniref:Ribosome maturation factor RimP n=1 Tax=Pilimelia columellifera subsp. columellifera TaxID=706583 RepID=A0ABP6ABS6_9ACTN
MRTNRASSPEAVRRDRVRAIVEPVVVAAGYDLEDLAMSRAGRRHLLRLTIDADGGITLDAVAVVSRAVSAALDAAEESGGVLFDGEYSLEVGSPGVDRPLRLPRHWGRNVGRLVRVQVRAEDAERRLTGRVVAADDEGVCLDVDGDEQSFGYERLGPGRVQIEFNRLDEVTDDDLDEIAPDEDEESDQR